MTIPAPKITAGNYVSYFCSRYYPWFVDMGYPRLDVLEYPDGEWAIIQMLKNPIVPAETSWRRVLEGMQNVEISYSFIRKYVEQIDIQRRAFWDREEAKSQQAAEDEKKMDEHREEMVEKAFTAIRNNPALMDRIARNGIQEINLDRIARHIPKSEH